MSSKKSDSTNEERFKQFINKEIYDKAAVTASRAYGMDRSTVNNMIELFQGDPIDASLLLMIWIKRQETRGEIRRPFSIMLIEDLSNIYSQFKDDKDKLEHAIRKYLTLIKWIFESRINNVNSIEEFIKKAGGK
ncbi:MAG: hypothetical protein QW572_07920 [Candidatus Nitrosocaldus sp.]